MTLQGVNSPLSGNASIDGFIWQEHPSYAAETPFQNSINFSFDNTLISDSGVRSGTHVMTAAEQQGVRNALNYVSQVTGITFNEVPAGSSATTELVFGYKEMGATSPASGEDYYTYNYTAGSSPTLKLSDTILLNYDRADESNLTPGTIGYQELLREIGHALGLKDPGQGSVTVPGLSDGNNASILTATNGPILTAYTSADLQALNWLYGGKGLVNKNQTPIGGSVSGSQTIIDQYAQNGAIVLNS
jgi:hypothetical protein